MSCRLFFALWPDDATRSALLALQARLSGGRPVPAANLHFTLAFLGQQPQDSVSALCALAARWTEFECLLRLDQLGYFRRSRIAWIGMRNAPEPLMTLQGSVLAALSEQGIVLPGEHGGFVPHVTLMRDAAVPPEGDVAPIPWRAKGVVLAESVARPGGSQYRILSATDTAG
jgi:RNA 2',3'-cyclic 3'-phosphodiesterase